VYLSDQFRDRYQTSEPVLFTAAVFLLYDYMVERRQKAVKKSALQSGTLVQSLFPEAVRDRLYQEQETKNEAATWEAEANTGVVDHKQAIASEYPETTIFFADLVGFIKWSATRTAVEVFQLLKALYGEFDVIANKRNVFKVETIGDCYVAVTGLPNPQDSMYVSSCLSFSVC
jgi:class 3 adenylate cyclase